MEKQTPIRSYTAAGAAMMQEMTKDPELFLRYLRFQGRVFKRPVNAALEFFSQDPDARFIASRSAWQQLGYTIRQGSQERHFLDEQGRNTAFYELSQTEEGHRPPMWIVTNQNAAAVKQFLGIAVDQQLISGSLRLYLDREFLTSCIRALHVSPSKTMEFSRSFANAVQQVIVGRLEVGGGKFTLPYDTAALQMLHTDDERFAYLTYVSAAARGILLRIENAVTNVNATERMKNDDLRSMEEFERGRTGERPGQRTAGDPDANAGEQADKGGLQAHERRAGLGDNTDSAERIEHKVVSNVSDEVGAGAGVLVQVRPDLRTVQSEPDRDRTDFGGRTDREVRDAVDGIHEGAVPASGGDDETTRSVPDSSTVGGEIRMGVPGNSGEGLSEDEPPTADRQLRGTATVQQSDGILHGQHSDAGESIDPSDKTVTEKLNSVFSAPAETEEALSERDTESAFVVSSGESGEKVDTYINLEINGLTDEEQLVQLTHEITQGKEELAALVEQEHFAEAAVCAEELAALTKRAEKVKARIQQKPLTVEDVKELRSIQPPRKSVQNLLEHEVAQTPKFEALLHSEMGERSAYEMRKSDDDWRNDKSKTVPVTTVKTRQLPKKISELRRGENVKGINRGAFVNDDTGIEVLFSRQAIDETISKAIQDDKRGIPVEPSIAALYQMQDILKNAVCFDSKISEYDTVTSKNKSPNTLFMHRMYGVFIYNGQPYLANLAIEELFQRNSDYQIESTQNRLYNLRSIKITPMKLGLNPHFQMPNGTGGVSIGVTTISIPQLYELVKTYDKNFFEDPETPGRGAREAELIADATYLDAVDTLRTGETVTEHSDKQISELAKNHALDPTKPEQIKQLLQQLKTERSRNGDMIFGNTKFRFIPQKSYTKAKLEHKDQICEKLLEKGIQFSGVIKGDEVTFTTSQKDKPVIKSIIAQITADPDAHEDENDNNSNTPGGSGNTPSDRNNSGGAAPSGNSDPDAGTHGSDEQTVQTHVSGNVDTYSNFSPVKPDSLEFHFGEEKDSEWFTESDLLYDFVQENPDHSFALGNAILQYLDEKQHLERNIPELKAGWYKKTDFSITAVINGEEFNYDGRFDIGDGMGTGGGSLIDHIRAYNEGILSYTQHPFNQPEYKERAQRTLDIFVPFLEAHSELTAEEQRIFEDLKAQHPIRTYDDVEKAVVSDEQEVSPLGTKDNGVSEEHEDPIDVTDHWTAHENAEKSIETPTSSRPTITCEWSESDVFEDGKTYSVADDLPEIFYASSPSEKISDNLAALRELVRLETAAKEQRPLYDKYHTKEESQMILRRYCGWGGLPQVFDERYKQYDFHRKTLHELLSPEEYAAARASTMNAHYTPQVLIDAMYQAVRNMDLPRDARILEPSCGTGNFISRLPSQFSEASVVGVELDNVTARIAAQLQRDHDNVSILHTGFEHAGLENNSFDLAIGNVPFGDYDLNDPDYVQNWRIHDAFFRKALDKVAPGGVVAFITSSGTMDKSNPKVREYLAERAELVGAIRLPNTAFSDAGTKVTSDIIFLKKRETPLQPHEPKPNWCYTVPNADGLMINSYFVSNSQMLLGKMEKTTHFDMLTCSPIEGADLGDQLNEAIRHLNAKITVQRREDAAEKRRGQIAPWGRNFCFHVKDGTVYYRQDQTMREIKGSPAEIKQLIQLCELRTIARELIDMQKTSVSDKALLPLREKLNEKYDAYREQYGVLSSPTVKKRFGDDPDHPILQSLERPVQDKNGTITYQKSDIFFRRTVDPLKEITSAADEEEALQISLDRRGKPDIPYMAVLLQKDADTVCSTLLEKGAIFVDPEKQIPDVPYSGIVERSEYLSGNVRRKLTFAEERAKSDPAFQRNVTALSQVIPEDIKANEISVRMGCTWIDPEDYTQFLLHLSGRSDHARRCDVTYSPVTGEYTVLKAGSQKDLNYNETTTYGTPDHNMYQLAEKVLNQRRIVVQREVPHPTDPSKVVHRTDAKATKIAHDKAKQIEEAFQKWIFNDPQRAAKYERRYNDIFNSLVGREYDGSKLSFSGMANNFTLREHQKNCVARAIYGGNTLAAHVVGAGKSAVMFTTVMKKKELGLISKACVVVPKALTEQTAREWRKLYPDARLLTVTNDDLSSEAKRDLFTARVATGSYDAVIMSQEQFEKIPMSRAYRAAFMQKELDHLEDMLRERKTETAGKRDYSVKAIERAKKQLQTRIEKLTDPKSAAKAKDSLLKFEQLGFDYLVCDEAHAYKNGFVTTKMTNVAGVTTRPSGRAEDMQMKTDYFNEQLGQGHILFCTGTPVSNTLTELYVMMRYLRPDLLREAGVERFDDWAATFGNVVTKNQQAADGTLKLRTSFAKFANLPELMAMYKEFADVQSADKLHLPRPELKTGKPQIISVKATPEQRAYVHELAARSKAISDGTVDPREDNMLKITSEARLVGLGNMAIRSLYEKRGEDVPDDFMDGGESKVDKCIENVAAIYQAHRDDKAVQIIFSDIAVNADNGSFSVYEYIKKKLTEDYSIPEDEIIFAPKADSKERENIFRDINEGKYRVVIASTGTLGTGANIQQNLYALHHIDVPWKPSDFEQREGRILRQGNNFPEVEIFNYVTEGTLDSYLYQTVTAKARFIAQLLDDKAPARVSEDCDEKVLTFGEIQAAAEGDPDFRRRIELNNEIAELTMLHTEFLHETAAAIRKTETIPEQINEKKDLLTRIRNDKAAAEQITDLVLTMPDGKRYTEKKDINEKLLQYVQQQMKQPDKSLPPADLNGFKVMVQVSADRADCSFTVKGESMYICSAGMTESQDNATRIKNVFESGIPKAEASAVRSIEALELDLEQARQRAEETSPHEMELAKAQEELEKLEVKLAGLSEQTDEILDPEDAVSPVTETKEEKAEREKLLKDVDDDDVSPFEKMGDRPNVPHTKK